MQHKFSSVECIGSAALVSLWTLNQPTGTCDSQVGSWGGTVIGNDSVIVADQLRKKGWASKCRLIDPTDSDLTIVKSLLGDDAVKPVGGQKGELTRSLCLEDEVGNRQWVFSRVPSPTSKLGELHADVTYIDYYPEFVCFLNRNLEGIKLNKTIVIANLSAISLLSEIPRLAIKPHILQASVSRDSSTDETIDLAKQMARVTGAENVFITMGNSGALLLAGGTSWFSPVPQKIAKSILGAGAVFSAEVIAALNNGLDRAALLEESVQQTAFRLEAYYENHRT